MQYKMSKLEWKIIGKNSGWLKEAMEKDDTKPSDYSEDNGHGKPTHLISKKGKWIKTPESYMQRSDGLPSHKYVRIDGEMEWVEVPQLEELERMMNDGVCESPDGETVEPDHPRSWLSILGVI